MSMIAPVLLRESDVSALADVLAPLLRAGDVLCLDGDLGAGKTTFARALVRAAVGAEVDVPSPTFTLVQTYDDAKPVPIWHFDLYRLTQPDEVLEIGWEEARATAVAVVEWPQRLGPYRPSERLDILFAPVSGQDDIRAVSFVANDVWAPRLKTLEQFCQARKSA